MQSHDGQPQADRSACGFYYAEHTADVLIRAWSTSMLGAVRQTLLATASLAVTTSQVRRTGERTVLIEAADPVAGLVAAANELLFLLDVEGFVAADIAVCPAPGSSCGAEGGASPASGGSCSWQITLSGDLLAEAIPPYQVGTIPKAATYHLATLAQVQQPLSSGYAAERWEASLVLDL